MSLFFFLLLLSPPFMFSPPLMIYAIIGSVKKKLHICGGGVGEGGGWVLGEVGLNPYFFVVGSSHVLYFLLLSV